MAKNQNDRRKFIRNLGIGSASLFAAPALANNSMFFNTREPEGKVFAESVLLGKDIELELLTKDDHFAGIGLVKIKGKILRDASIPMFCEIRTPDGIQIDQYPVIHKTITPEKIEIKMGAFTKRVPVMEYMLHSVRNRENLYGWSEGIVERPDTFLTLTIFPVTRTFGDQIYSGFSYRYQFESRELPIFKILDHGTWEIGGKAIGNECWMRVGHVPSIVSFDSADQTYSTENYYAGIANPNVFQFLPLQTELQGFTFQAHHDGILITWPTEIAHVRTLLEKPAGNDHVFHFHQHCNDLSHEFGTSPVEVLWLEVANTSRVERYNLFESARTTVQAHLLQKSGIKPERVTSYGVLEEWTEPDFDKYTNVILPQFIERGVKRIYIPNEFQNAMNTWGLMNMCCNVDFKFSETVGTDKITEFFAKANAAGISIDMWGNTAISTLTEMFQRKEGYQKGIQFLPEKGSIGEVLKKSKDPFVRNPSNAIEADHYTPVFAVLNLRDADIKAYWMQQWKMAFNSGLRGIFLDSSFNLSSDKFHFIQSTDRSEGSGYYRPSIQPPAKILTQYHAYLEWIKEMQGIGYSFCGEDLGVFGVHRHGPDLDMIIDCLPLFTDSFMDFDEKLAIKAGQDPLYVFFKGLAYRIMWMMKWDFKKEQLSLGITNPEAFAFIKYFNDVNECMQVREILEDEKGVKYEGLRNRQLCSVYWIFQPLVIQLKEISSIRELTTNKKIRGKAIQGKPFSIYIVTA